jgi:hypothetical protein
MSQITSYSSYVQPVMAGRLQAGHRPKITALAARAGREREMPW